MRDESVGKKRHVSRRRPGLGAGTAIIPLLLLAGSDDCSIPTSPSPVDPPGTAATALASPIASLPKDTSDGSPEGVALCHAGQMVTPVPCRTKSGYAMADEKSL